MASSDFTPNDLVCTISSLYIALHYCCHYSGVVYLYRFRVSWSVCGSGFLAVSGSRRASRPIIIDNIAMLAVVTYGTWRAYNEMIKFILMIF